MRRLSTLVLAILVAGLAAQLLRLGVLAPILVVGVLLACNLAAARWRRVRNAAVENPRWYAGPLVVCWLVATLLPMHQFSHEGITARGPALTPESILELLLFVLVGFVALAVVRRLEPTLALARPPAVLFLYPIWVSITCFWSATGPYALARGLELCATALLAWATVAVGRSDLAAMEAMVEVILRWFIRVTVVLVGLGVAFGPVYVLASADNQDRFTWAGAHPLAAGVILSVATVIAATASTRVLGVPVLVRAAMLGVFVAALVSNHSRQSWAGLVAVYIVALALKGRLTPMLRRVGAPLAGAAAVAGFMYRREQLWSYVLRDGDPSTLLTGNGRLQLWGIGFRSLDTWFDWLNGLGFGVTRTLFTPEVFWAQTAHSSLLAVLVSTGLIGVGLFVALVLRPARDLLRDRSWARVEIGLTLTLLLLLVVINGVVSDNLAIPNIGSSILFLIAAVGIVLRGEPLAAPAPQTARVPVAQARK